MYKRPFTCIKIAKVADNSNRLHDNSNRLHLRESLLASVTCTIYYKQHFNVWFTSQTTIIILSMSKKAIAVALLSDHIAFSLFGVTGFVILARSHSHGRVVSTIPHSYQLNVFFIYRKLYLYNIIAIHF